MKNIEPEGKGRTFHIEPLIAALVLAAAGQHYLYNAKAALPGMILFALAAGLFIFADMRAQKAGITGAPGVPLKAEIVIFAGIMLAAVFFRFYMLDTLPAGAHRDEAKAALDALYLAAGRQPLDSGSKFPVYIGGITDNPAFYNYVMGVFYGFIDHGIMPARAASAFLGVLAVAAVYFLARASFGVNVAVAAGFMTAVSRWHFTFTRHVLHAGLLVFILALALYFCVKARRQGRTALFLLAGACCGMVFYTFQASRAFAVVMLVCAALLFIVDRAFLRENRDRVAAGSTVFLIVIIPLAVYAVFNGQVFMKRANELFLFSQARLAAMQGGAPELLQVYLASLKKSLLMFNVTGSANLVYNYNYRPMFDMVTGAFFMMGLFYSVYRASLGSRLHICLIVLFLAGIHGTALFIEAPYATRGILALLPALLMAACAAERLFSLAYRAATGMAKPAAVAGAAALAFAAASLNYTGYFVDFKRDSLAWDAFSADSRLAGAYFRKMMPGWNAILDPRYTQPYENYSFVLECGCLDYPGIETMDFERHVLKGALKKGSNVFLLGQPYFGTASYLEDVYPGGILDAVYEVYNPQKMSFFAYKVPEGSKFAPPASQNKGLSAVYQQAAGTKPALNRVDPAVSFKWPDSAPAGVPFNAEWQGNIRIEKAGAYDFLIYSSGASRLEIDGQELFVSGKRPRGLPESGRLKLYSGLHRLKITARFENLPAMIEFSYSGPDTGNKYKVVPYDRLSR